MQERVFFRLNYFWLSDCLDALLELFDLDALFFVVLDEPQSDDLEPEQFFVF